MSEVLFEDEECYFENFNPDFDTFERPLAQLEAVLASLQPTLGYSSSSSTTNIAEDCGVLEPGYRVREQLRQAAQPEAEEAMRAFQAPLADLQALCNMLPQPKAMGSRMQPAG